MALEMPTEEWKQNKPDFHLDPTKADQEKPQDATLDAALKDEIMQAPFEVIDEAMDHIAELINTNPGYLQQHPEAMEKINLVVERFNKIQKDAQH